MDANLPPDTTSRDSTETEYGEKSPFRAARKEPLLTRAIPVAGQLPGYRAPNARRDRVAGVTVAALALPSAMAYAEVAGLSPVNGLYALLLPTVAYVLLGSSRQVSWLVFDAEAVTHADSTGLEALGQLTKDRRSDGITLVVARLRTRMEESFALAGVTKTIGREHFDPSVRAAVDAFASPTRRR